MAESEIDECKMRRFGGKLNEHFAFFDTDDETDAPNAWSVDLARYKDEHPISETENPVTWWRLNRNRFPVLANFVKTVLCVPATSVPCERICLVLPGKS